jgi:flavorubredoxin
MGITNAQSGTRVDEIAEGIYRLCTPVGPVGAGAARGGFTFNQFLVVDDEPTLFHTGPKRLFPVVREAVASVIAPESLRWIAFSHWEPDESGSLNEWLEAAPQATAVQGRVGTQVCVSDQAIRPGRALGDGEVLSIGKKALAWIDAPHLPHAWECGFLFEETTRTLLCGDLFTQGGHEHAPLVETDILGPSEELRKRMDYFSHTTRTRELMEKLASRSPSTLACMHGSSWRGDGAKLLRELARELTRDSANTENTPNTKP